LLSGEAVSCQPHSHVQSSDVPCLSRQPRANSTTGSAIAGNSAKLLLQSRDIRQDQAQIEGFDPISVIAEDPFHRSVSGAVCRFIGREKVGAGTEDFSARQFHSLMDSGLFCILAAVQHSSWIPGAASHDQRPAIQIWGVRFFHLHR
jgi:hypothetical protein